jgi:hypothetical protein
MSKRYVVSGDLFGVARDMVGSRKAKEGKYSGQARGIFIDSRVTRECNKASES